MLVMLQTPNLKSGVNTAHRLWNFTFSEYFIAILFQATFRNNKSSNLHWTLTPLSSVTAEKSWFSYDLGNAGPWEVFWQEKPLQLQLGNIYWNEIIYLIVWLPLSNDIPRIVFWGKKYVIRRGEKVVKLIQQLLY